MWSDASVNISSRVLILSYKCALEKMKKNYKVRYSVLIK